MTDTERSLLNAEIERLMAENAALRQQLQVVIDRAAPIPSEEPGKSPVGMSGFWNWTEWRFITGEGPL